MLVVWRSGDARGMEVGCCSWYGGRVLLVVWRSGDARGMEVVKLF